MKKLIHILQFALVIQAMIGITILFILDVRQEIKWILLINVAISFVALVTAIFSESYIQDLEKHIADNEKPTTIQDIDDSY